jgi:hypothetical protein
MKKKAKKKIKRVNRTEMKKIRGGAGFHTELTDAEFHAKVAAHSLGRKIGGTVK